MNMHYCRFHNTLDDLRQCADAWDEDEEPLSQEEARAKKQLLALMAMLVDQYGDTNEHP